MPKKKKVKIIKKKKSLKNKKINKIKNKSKVELKTNDKKPTSLSSEEKPEIKNDSMLLAKTDKVINKLENLKETNINESVLRTVLSTQKLVKELSDDAN